jgi:hypothetical protein
LLVYAYRAIERQMNEPIELARIFRLRGSGKRRSSRHSLAAQSNIVQAKLQKNNVDDPASWEWIHWQKWLTWTQKARLFSSMTSPSCIEPQAYLSLLSVQNVTADMSQSFDSSQWFQAMHSFNFAVNCGGISEGLGRGSFSAYNGSFCNINGTKQYCEWNEDTWKCWRRFC